LILAKKKIYGGIFTAIDFLFYEVLVVVTYPPDHLPLGIGEGKGVDFKEGSSPSQ